MANITSNNFTKNTGEIEGGAISFNFIEPREINNTYD